MDDLDFSAKPTPPAAAAAAAQTTAQSPLYNPAIAFDFFRSAGSAELRPAAKPIFSENEKSGGLFGKAAKMYLLIEGEAALMIGGKFFGVIKKGDLFGELAVIAGLPRSATAFAKTECKLMTLDEKQFQTALQKKPEFALMLMGIMIGRMRQSIAKLGPAATGAGPVDRGGALDKKMLAELIKHLGGDPVSYPTGKVVMSAGAAGAFMYVVVDGRVAISIQDTVVERVGAGGMFGEMALVDRSARAASAAAEVDSQLVGIGRNDFLELVRAKPAFGAILLKSIAERMHHLAMQVARAQS